MKGGRFSSESLKGKVAVINFWGVWCSPCVREAPQVQQFAEEFRDRPANPTPYRPTLFWTGRPRPVGIGASLWLVDAYTWRIEALLAGPYPANGGHD
jgi:hypothetical protein